MRAVFLFLLAGVVLSATNLVDLHIQCPEQEVPDLSRICIKPDYIEGCLAYKNTKECDECSKDYEPIDGKCSLISENAMNPTVLVGCLKESEGSCLNCANGFRRISGKCLQGVKECVEYDQEGNCDSCEPEFSLLQGQCRHNLLLGCKVELSDHRCSECFAPFQLQEYNCGIKHCKTYNDYGCYTCQCGFFITEARSCQKYEPGCMKYYRGMCTECMPHFKLRGGACMIDGCLEHQDYACTACKDGYDLARGICELKDCLDWQEDSCLICKQGFNLHQGKCVKSEKKFVCSG